MTAPTSRARAYLAEVCGHLEGEERAACEREVRRSLSYALAELGDALRTLGRALADELRLERAVAWLDRLGRRIGP
jgi:hypothetical protein